MKLESLRAELVAHRAVVLGLVVDAYRDCAAVSVCNRKVVEIKGRPGGRALGLDREQDVAPGHAHSGFGAAAVILCLLLGIRGLALCDLLLEPPVLDDLIPGDRLAHCFSR